MFLCKRSILSGPLKLKKRTFSSATPRNPVKTVNKETINRLDYKTNTKSMITKSKIKRTFGLIRFIFDFPYLLSAKALIERIIDGWMLMVILKVLNQALIFSRTEK